jgi:hypothetical protein
MGAKRTGSDAADGCFRPLSYAAACLAQVAESVVSKKQVATAAGLTTLTLTKCMRHLAAA